MAQDSEQALKEFKKFQEDMKLDAEILVLKTFPHKTMELQKLIMSDKFDQANQQSIKTEINIPVPEYPFVEPATSTSNDVSTENGPVPKKRKYVVVDGDAKVTTSPIDDKRTLNFESPQGSRVIVLPYGPVQSNQKIVELIDIVKPFIRQLVEDCNLLKMWVLFLIPRIEDGNNFGVSIQEDILSEIRTVEAEASAYFDQMSRYFMSRAKIVTKIAKYPHVHDFRRTVEEVDEKEFLTLRLTLAELRNHYASLHDIVTKNLEKIKKPRNINTVTMY